MTLNIATERLILRPFQASDAPRVRALINSYAIASKLGRLPHPYPEGEAERWINTHDGQRAAGTGYPFAVEKDGLLIGTVSVENEGDDEFELGYWLGVDYWGNGYATEATTAVLSLAFGWYGLPYVRARHAADNPASARVLAKLGFLATHRSRKFHHVRGEEIDMVHLVLPRNAFVRDDAGAKKVYMAA